MPGQCPVPHLLSLLLTVPAAQAGEGEAGRACRQLPESPPSHFSAFETKCSVVVAVRLQKGVRSPIGPVLATKLQ